jgi:predicted amidohydrolase
MMQIRVCGAQVPVTADIPANLAAICRSLDGAAEHGANLLLTPEGSLSGYTADFDQDAVTRALDVILERASAAAVALALGTCFVEPEDGRCYNQIRFYAADGTYQGFHSKTLTCGSLEQPSRGEIEHYAVRPLRLFDLLGVPVGGLICNDLWANPQCTPGPDPHLTQQLAGMGARIIFHAVNGGRDGGEWSGVAWRFHEANLQMRARAAGAWIVTVDSSFPHKWPCSAPSGVINPDGAWVCRSESVGEQLFVHDLQLDTGAG